MANKLIYIESCYRKIKQMMVYCQVEATFAQKVLAPSAALLCLCESKMYQTIKAMFLFRLLK